LYALPILCDRIKAMNLRDPIVVSPDVGFAKQARRYAANLGTGIAIAYKERPSLREEKADILEIIGNVQDKTAIIVDDFTLSAGTLVGVSRKLIDEGATEVYAAVTHGVLAGDAVEKIEHSPIKCLLMTDTVENQPVQLTAKIEIVSVASVFGEAIKRIHNRESISEMFKDI
ncbi:MAG TPA: ribose-phosphate diphosphokinase, partial [Ktedonobacteraceae bacterium]|nr:ribose-phosphate diphosphokinase [Ktedonobacteraceae bacterium]